ncbi:hypothetical protein WMY93_031593 [Mugilogobius chulae]|uniref:Uncharacterized protein n=1 Tax=Mugilogobius chulae TaxID=88201 RepID=A0AAW0MLT1_9GOBI
MELVLRPERACRSVENSQGQSRNSQGQSRTVRVSPGTAGSVQEQAGSGVSPGTRSGSQGQSRNSQGQGSVQEQSGSVQEQSGSGVSPGTVRVSPGTVRVRVSPGTVRVRDCVTRLTRSSRQLRSENRDDSDAHNRTEPEPDLARFRSSETLDPDSLTCSSSFVPSARSQMIQRRFRDGSDAPMFTRTR